MIKALKSNFQNIIRLQNGNAVAFDFHAMYLSYLEACGRKKEAFKHVLKLIDENLDTTTFIIFIIFIIIICISIQIFIDN